MILGITGGSGSGKTTLLQLLQERGAMVLDCDQIYHELLQRDLPMLLEISRRFPGSVEQGQLNRKKLGSIVFADEAALQDLNAITHRAVRKEVLLRLKDAPPLSAIDAIALFEGDLAKLCDVTVAVIAPVEVRIRRLMTRDNISEDYARKRIAAQHSTDWFCAHCDFVLENSGNLSDFYQLCHSFLGQLNIESYRK